MKTEFRNRVFYPIVLPLAVLLSMVLFIGAVASILLFNTHEGALATAAVAAFGILLTVSLASSQDKLDTPRKAVVMVAVLVPFAIGGAFATGLIGDIDDADRLINVQPRLVIPDDAPVIAAENSADFCIPSDSGCEDAALWEVTPSAEAENLTFVFDNRESGIPHNVEITDLQGTVDDPSAGSEVFVVTDPVTGPTEDGFLDPELTWDDLPEQWYFFCTIHPNMSGVGTVVAAG